MALNLTDGERDVLERLANGYERKDIAKELGVSLSTVHNRVYEAQRRIGCRTSYHLVAWFIRDAVVAQLTAAPEGAEASE